MFNSTFSQSLRTFINRYGSILCILIAFLIPIKLAATYAVLLPTVLVWSLAGAPGGREAAMRLRPVLIPFAFLIGVYVLSSAVGIDPFHSIRPLLSLTFFGIALVFFTRYSNIIHSSLALVVGQSLAAFHSIVDSAFPQTLPRMFVGTVAESGQLTMSIFMAAGLATIFLWRGTITPDEKSAALPAKNLARVCGLGLCLLVALFCLGFGQYYGISFGVQIFLAVTLGLYVVINLFSLRNTKLPHYGAQLIFVVLPLLTLALLVNLKRGPWVGVTGGALIGLILLAPRLVPTALLAVGTLAVAVNPIRDRLAHSYEHFTISGGREVIWDIGSELAWRYPLGIGFQNSGVLRNFSAEIPPGLQHFHSNFLNVLVEAGPIGLGIFIWFIISVLRRTFHYRSNLIEPRLILGLAFGLGIIAWQIAGVVEYSFGDTEVLLVFLALLGAYFSEEPIADSTSAHLRVDQSSQRLDLASYG